jgi:hypothetical protein
MDDFEKAWRGFYPSCYPIGYMMRSAGAEHWIRFHSLPQSKRYADSDDEVRTLLHRQNELAREVLGSTPCWLVQTCWETPRGSVEVSDEKVAFSACREFKLSFSFRFIQEDGEVGWNAFTRLTSWGDRTFDGLLLAIAGERAAPTMWVSNDTGAVFAPYDGGVDLFLPMAASVESLKSKHADWLSRHSKGL